MVNVKPEIISNKTTASVILKDQEKIYEYLRNAANGEININSKKVIDGIVIEQTLGNVMDRLNDPIKTHTHVFPS